MSTIKKIKSPTGCAPINGLPQPVKNKNTGIQNVPWTLLQQSNV